MIRKTDKYSKRFVSKWDYRLFERRLSSDVTDELYRRETWWLFWIIPLYSRDTIINKAV